MLVTSFPVIDHLTLGAHGSFKEQIETEEKAKGDAIVFKIERQKITLEDYDDMVCTLIDPHFYVSPVEHILPQTGRKKRVKSCLQNNSIFN